MCVAISLKSDSFSNSSTSKSNGLMNSNLDMLSTFSSYCFKVIQAEICAKCIGPKQCMGAISDIK